MNAESCKRCGNSTFYKFPVKFIELCSSCNRTEYIEFCSHNSIKLCNIKRYCFAPLKPDEKRCDNCEVRNKIKNRIDYERKKNKVAKKIEECEDKSKKICTKCAGVFSPFTTGNAQLSTKCEKCFSVQKAIDDARSPTRKVDYGLQKLNNLETAFNKLGKKRHDSVDIENKLELDHFKKLVTSPCYYCGTYTPDAAIGIDRKSSNGAYTFENCVPCCSVCNRMKHSREFEYFIAKVAAISNGDSITPLANKWPHYYSKRDSSYSKYRVDAKKRNLIFDLTSSEFTSFIRGPCYYCGYDKYIGIDRMDNSIGYYKSNCVSSCYDCNHMKNTMNTADFLQKISEINLYYHRVSCISPVITDTIPEDKKKKIQEIVIEKKKIYTDTSKITLISRNIDSSFIPIEFNYISTKYANSTGKLKGSYFYIPDGKNKILISKTSNKISDIEKLIQAIDKYYEIKDENLYNKLEYTREFLESKILDDREYHSLYIENFRKERMKDDNETEEAASAEIIHIPERSADSNVDNIIVHKTLPDYVVFNETNHTYQIMKKHPTKKARRYHNLNNKFLNFARLLEYLNQPLEESYNVKEHFNNVTESIIHYTKEEYVNNVIRELENLIVIVESEPIIIDREILMLPDSPTSRKFPEGINDMDVPKYCLYIKPSGLLGCSFAIDKSHPYFKKIKIINPDHPYSKKSQLRTTSSNKISIEDKLSLLKSIVIELYNLTK